jgi:hypothetical protein
MSAQDNNDQYFVECNKQYVEIAEKFGLVADLCRLVAYDPEVGDVPENWRASYLQFFEAARALGAIPGTRTSYDDVVHTSLERGVVSAGADKWNAELEERLAAVLGWEIQPRQPNELFHRWKRPSGTLREGRPHWTLDSEAALALAADLEISTSYRGGLVIASFAGANNAMVHVEEAIENHKDKVGALRTVIVRAAVIKLEAQLEAKPAAPHASSPEA